MPESEGRRGSTAHSAAKTSTDKPSTEPPENLVGSASTEQFLIAPRAGSTARSFGVQPLSVNMLNAAVQGLDVVRRIKRPRATLATLGIGQGEATDVLVANMEPERAQLMAATAPQLSIGRNSTLTYGSGPATMREAFFPAAAVKPRQLRFRVLGENDRPLEGAVVTLTGDTVPSQGTTNTKGEVTLDLYTLHDRPARSLFVTRPGGYWDMYLTEPSLTDRTGNTVRLKAYSETIEDFPKGFQYGWGQRLMALDHLGPELRGEGVKVAIIDSGADNTHPLLSHIKIGRDFSNGNPTTWSNDVVGHGSHCAGVIGARSDEQLRGFVPEAEIHILKVFPGGRYDSLVDALDYCIDHQIDVVNMSLGGDDEINPVVEETLIAAVNAGVACIVAAGNSGDAVKYPGKSPNSFAVAAIGSIDDAMPNTWDRSNLRPQYLAADGVFSPAFTCHGPEVAVCAPGVAIISTIPGSGFEAQTGTSMAAPHITGLAALLLAHHPIFRESLAGRGQARVAGLFSMMRSMCVPYPFGPTRVGAGMPTLAGMDRILQPAGRQTGDKPAEQALSPQGAGPAMGGFGTLMPFQAVPGMIPVPVPTPVPANVDPQVLAWLLRQSQAGPNPQVCWLLNRLTGGV
jgi:subtilisin